MSATSWKTASLGSVCLLAVMSLVWVAYAKTGVGSDETPRTPSTAQQENGTEVQDPLSRSTLESWTLPLLNQPVDQIDLPSDVALQILEQWITLDVDRALEFEQHLRPKYFGYANVQLVSKLASLNRWDDIAELQSPSDFRSPLSLERWLIIWSQLAIRGRDDRDMSLIERAAAQVDRVELEIKRMHESDENRVRGQLSDDWGQLSQARYIIASMRLELARETLLQGELVDTKTYELFPLINDLHLAAGSIPVVTQSSLLSEPRPAVRQRLLDYAALESWHPCEEVLSDDRTFFASGTGHYTRLSDWGTEHLKPILAQPVSWGNISLPTADSPVVLDWTQRQVETDNLQVVLAYLANCEGSPAGKARVLARISSHLCPKSDEGQTSSRLAQELIDSFNEPWTKEESLAAAELAFANRQKNEDPSSVTALATRTLVTSTPEALTDYELGCVLYELLNSSGETAKLDSAATARWNFLLETLFKETKDQRNYVFRGKLRTIAPPGFKTRSETRYKEHEEYYRLVEAKEWPKVVDEIRRLAQGNGAWVTSYLEVGGMSTEDLGLAATLEWSQHIEPRSTRMRVELGAIRQTLPTEPEPLTTYFDIYSGNSLLRVVGWLSDGC